MAWAESAQEAKFLFEISGASYETLVVDFTANERISSPYEISIFLACEDEINFDDVIGKEAFLTIRGDEEDRYLHGIINNFMQTGSKGRFYLYQASLVPSLWLLSLEQDCRIFQNKSVQDIVKQILQDGGITSDRFDFRLQNQYKPREYCVQYRETDLNFISRLLEEEGIFYFFEHTEDKHLLVFADSAVAYQPIQGEPQVTFNPSDGAVPEEECVYGFSFSRKILSGKITQRDFNFEKPSLDLTAREEADSFKKFEVYDYPGEYLDQERGKKLTQIRLQESMTYKDIAEGQSVCPRLIPGLTFKLTDHEHENFNQEYLLVEVINSGSQPQVFQEHAGGGAMSYSNDFLGIPSSVTLRPERNTMKPAVEGVQTAIVVGPSGEEIYTDEHGRVKVQFHWDREGKKDEKSSCWIRVSQNWAGKSWGGIFIPRIGHEVIIDFIEGDPDRPIITGRVYNGENPVPYPLPADKTMSTIKSDSSPGGGGSNELRFEDAAGKEEIYLHGQKDWTIAIENDKNQTVGNDETLSVGNNRTKSVGNDESNTIGKNRTESVGEDESITIGGNRTESVGKDESINIGKNRTESVGENESISIGGNRTESVGKDESITISGARTKSVEKDETVSITGNLAISVEKSNSIDVTKNYSLNAKKISINADDEIQIVTGSSRIIMKKNGNIQIEGKNINIKASGDIKMKGSKIVQN